VIPDPDTGKERSWTRATTLAGTLADRFGLEQWSKRNVVLGIGARADLYAQAASCTPEDKGVLNRIVAQAEEASKSHAGANLGTALHRFTERVDAGEDVSPPAPWDADVAAYVETMKAHGVAVLPDWIERVLLVPSLGVAGTCDRLCNAMEWALPRIGDLKTGKDVLRYSMPEIAIQLALYSRATHWFDPKSEQLFEIELQIDQELALVMHLPVGQASCTLYEVDIAAGWEMAQVAAGVREWRKRKDLAGQLVPVNGTTGTPQDRQTPSGSPGKVPSRENGDQPAEGSVPADTPAEGTPSAGPAPDPHVAEVEQLLRSGHAGDIGPGEITQADLESETNEELHQARLVWLRDRIQTIKDHSPEAVEMLAREWSTHAHIPTLKAGGPRDAEEVEVVARSCSLVEKEHGIPFPPEEPGVEVVTKRTRKVSPKQSPNKRKAKL
jgi:hypothetical protein